MNLKFFCEKCDTEIRKGEKYCHECGEKIDWPEGQDFEENVEEATAHAKKRNINTSDRKVITKFVDRVTGSIIGTLLFGVCGLIIGIAMLVRCSKIRKILYDEKLTNEEMAIIQKKILNIRSEAKFVMVLNIIVGIVTLYAVVAAQTTTGYGGAEIVLNIFLTAVAYLVGILFAHSVSSKANDALEALSE